MGIPVDIGELRQSGELANWRTGELANSRAIVLEFVKRYYASVGRSPSYREIGAATRLSRRAVQRAVHGLETEGEVVLHPGPRGILLPDVDDRLSYGDVLRVLVKRGFYVDLQAALAVRPPEA